MDEGVEDVEVDTLLVCDLDVAIRTFEARNYRLDMVAPADAPRMAEMSLDEERLRLIVGEPTDWALKSEGDFSDEFVLTHGTRSGSDVDVGRAGMQYRDLIPSRHGGHVIASHIVIPGSGPIADYVHHHDINFQVIFVRSGRVKVVYEDQGEPFWMEAGDCVLQPPHIRHRVLESADDCEVIEVASPGEHPTFVEHELELPTGTLDAARNFGGQRFCFAQAAGASWSAIDGGWEERDLGIRAGADGVGDVRVLRSVSVGSVSSIHNGSLCLLVLLDGICTLDTDGDFGVHNLTAGDCVAIPTGTIWTLSEPDPQCSVLHVTMT